MKVARSISPLLGLAFLSAVLMGCSSSPTAVNYDPSVDFSAYKTYAFMADMAENKEPYQSLEATYLKKALARELEKSGLQATTTDPDLLINFNANLQDKTKVTTSPSMYSSAYYGYRRGYYDPWVGYGYGTETHVSQYTEGTFNIDLIDPKTKRLVWEAVGVGRISDDTFENLEQKVAEGVPRFFALYPFRAGDGTVYEAED